MGEKISALIDTTDGCNLQCSFCSRKNSKIEMMSTENFSTVLKKIRPYVENVQLCCAWEYSIAANAHKIVKLLGNYQFSSSTIYTNGQILPDQLAQSIIDAKIDNLVFSVGEAKKETYERLRRGGKFEKVLANIAKLSDLKQRVDAKAPRLCANLTLINSNIAELPDFVPLAFHLGIREIRGRHLILNEGLEMSDEVIRDTVSANAILDLSEQKARAYGIAFNIPRYGNAVRSKNCKAPWTQLYIGSDGNVSVCPRIHKYAVIGNILQQDMQQILTNPAILSLQQQMQKRQFVNPVCGICVENLENQQAINQGF
jgi:radical SAM protein with 4Fe4S-binding SPASM domain